MGENVGCLVSRGDTRRGWPLEAAAAAGSDSPRDKERGGGRQVGAGA